MRANTWVEINDGDRYEGEVGYVTEQIDTHRFRVFVASVDAHVRTFTRRQLRRMTPGERRRYIKSHHSEESADQFDDACREDDAAALLAGAAAYDFGGGVAAAV